VFGAEKWKTPKRSCIKRLRVVRELVPVAGVEPARCCHHWILSFTIRTVDSDFERSATVMRDTKNPVKSALCRQFISENATASKFVQKDDFEEKFGRMRDIRGTSTK